MGLWAQETPVLPTPENNQIMYRSSDHQKITPNATDAFGATYDDSNSMYDTQNDYGVITFDGNVTTIGDWAFTNSTTLTAVAWPSAVTDIGYEAFKGWTFLTTLTVKGGSIGGEAFANCTNLITGRQKTDRSIAQLLGIADISIANTQTRSRSFSAKWPNLAPTARRWKSRKVTRPSDCITPRRWSSEKRNKQRR